MALNIADPTVPWFKGQRFHILEWSKLRLRICHLTQAAPVKKLNGFCWLLQLCYKFLRPIIHPAWLQLLHNPASGCQSGFTRCGRCLCRSSPTRLSLHFLLGYVWCCWGLKQSLKTTRIVALDWVDLAVSPAVDLSLQSGNRVSDRAMEGGTSHEESPPAAPGHSDVRMSLLMRRTCPAFAFLLTQGES